MVLCYKVAHSIAGRMDGLPRVTAIMAKLLECSRTVAHKSYTEGT